MRAAARARAKRCAVVSWHLSPDAMKWKVVAWWTRRGRTRRKAFWIVRACAPHRAYVRRFWLAGENRTTGNGARGELSSRTGAEGWCLQATEDVRGGIASGKGSSSPRKARRVGHRGVRARKGRSHITLDASERVHRSWRKRIAAPRLEGHGFRQRELCGIPSAPLSYHDAQGLRTPGTRAPCEVRTAPSLNHSATTSRHRTQRASTLPDNTW